MTVPVGERSQPVSGQNEKSMTSYQQYLKSEVPDEKHIDRMHLYYTRLAHLGHSVQRCGDLWPVHRWTAGYHNPYPSPGVQDGHLGRVDMVAAPTSAILQPTATLSSNQKATATLTTAAAAYSRATDTLGI